MLELLHPSREGIYRSRSRLSANFRTAVPFWFTDFFVIIEKRLNMSKGSESCAKSQSDMQLEMRLTCGNDNAPTIAVVRQMLKEVISDMLSWKRFYPQLASLPDTTDDCVNNGIHTTLEFSNQDDGCDRTSAMLSDSNSNAKNSDSNPGDILLDFVAFLSKRKSAFCMLAFKRQ